jgi:hypothetical protein
LQDQWQGLSSHNRIRFTTLSDYVDAVLPRIRSGQIAIPTNHAGTAYDFDAFWIENPEVKTRYRRSEQAPQAAEMLSAVASLRGTFPYPYTDTYHGWILMCLNMDRNTLWGSAGGMVFVSGTSWDARDRFDWVAKTTARLLDGAGMSLLKKGEGLGIFNSLNWQRTDPIALALPASTTIEGIDCEALPDGSVLCALSLPPFSVGTHKLSNKPPTTPEPVDPAAAIETKHYSARIDLKTGALASLRLKPSGRELLAGPANVLVAERPTKEERNPGDFMPPRPGRTSFATSSDSEPLFAFFAVRWPQRWKPRELSAGRRCTAAYVFIKLIRGLTSRPNSTMFPITLSSSRNSRWLKMSPKFDAASRTDLLTAVGPGRSAICPAGTGESSPPSAGWTFNWREAEALRCSTAA